MEKLSSTKLVPGAKKDGDGYFKRSQKENNNICRCINTWVEIVLEDVHQFADKNITHEEGVACCGFLCIFDT